MNVGTFSKDIHLIKHINRFLGTDNVALFPSPSTCQNLDLIVGWGQDLNATNARQTADFHGLKFQTIEDGFIGCGKNNMPRISIVIDKMGIHYDSRTRSSLEDLLNSDDKTFNKKLTTEAKKAITFIRKNKLSKYPGNESIPLNRFSSEQPNILIVDQQLSDPSIQYGAKVDIDNMVTTALIENPAAKIYIKLMPEAFTGSSKSILAGFHKHPRIELIVENYNPVALLEKMDKVYVNSSHFGFEALLLGKEIVCFGLPFYAGWGATDDRSECLRRQKLRSTEEIFAAAYILYSHYVHPVSGSHCNIFSALEYLQEQLKVETENQADVYCFGVRHWTRANIKPFLHSSHNRIVFVKSVSAAKQVGIKLGDRVAIWGTRKPDRLEELIAITGQQPIKLENGFLESLGFESKSAQPTSLLLDTKASYSACAELSTLDSILQNTNFTSQQIKKSASIRHKITAARKSRLVLKTDAVTNQIIILIPGQIESEESAILTSNNITTNLALIHSVREYNPDAYLIYKPHPQVANGSALGKVHPDTVLKYCDQYVDLSDIPTCLETVDEVHTMTSMVGFEALIKGIPVTTYGRPFYSGWNLTTDLSTQLTFRKNLSIDELIAGALLVYPRYYDWDSGSFTDCESVIDKFTAKIEATPKKNIKKFPFNYGENKINKIRILVEGLIS